MSVSRSRWLRAEARTFALPAADDPLRIDLDAISVNGGIQTPSEVFSALVNVDANGAGMSWIGTRSDGSRNPGTRLPEARPSPS